MSAAPGVRAAAPARDPTPVDLQLEVVLNGQRLELIAAFRQEPGGSLSATPGELAAIGLMVPPGDRPIALDALAGIAYRYDEPGQRIYVEARPEAIVPLRISLSGGAAPAPPSHDVGGLMNYSVAVQGSHGDGRGWADGVRASGLFEARAFGPFGEVATSYTGAVGDGRSKAVRLETAWRLSRPRDAVTWQAGDLISGGFAWTRPIRLGGAQVRRDFATRPDIVTIPMPRLSTSAAAPSVLDVVLGSSVALSRRVPVGPVEIADLPVVQGRGLARVILRDAYGLAQEVAVPYYATPRLLRAGMVDYSVEAGFPRRDFGLQSHDYGGDLLAVGSLRYGWTDSVTLEAHAEGGGGVSNGGAGISAVLRDAAVISVAAAASRWHGRDGTLFAAAFETQTGDLRLTAQYQQLSSGYADLAAASAPVLTPDARRSLLQLGASGPLRLRGLGAAGESLWFSLGYAETRGRNDASRSLATATLRSDLGRQLSVMVTAYAATNGHDDRGVSVRFTAPLGRDLWSSGGVEHARGQNTAFAEVRRQERLEPGAFGWRLRADEGADHAVEGEAIYNSPVARLTALAAYRDGRTAVQAQADGALVWLGGPLIAPQRIDGAFAVIDVGAPGVRVRQQNRPIGATGANGRLIATHIDAYNANTLELVAADIPLDYLAPVTRMVVSPPYGAGALAAFGVQRVTQAVVRLRLPDGSPPPVGALAALNDGPADLVVGYDGDVFVPRPAAANTLRVGLGEAGVCTARFALDPAARGIVNVAPVVCH